jgi:hypothetical protein
MPILTKEIQDELVEAMDSYKDIAQGLIDRLILETEQPEKNKILDGHYDEIQNAKTLNGQENLFDNWWFDIHGEHCLFKHLTTGQTLEVSLGTKDSLGNLDPYFFYNFLKTTDKLKHLIEYFRNPFDDMVNFFEELEKQKLMIRIHGVEYRKNI